MSPLLSFPLAHRHFSPFTLCSLFTFLLLLLPLPSFPLELLYPLLFSLLSLFSFTRSLSLSPPLSPLNLLFPANLFPIFSLVMTCPLPIIHSSLFPFIHPSPLLPLILLHILLYSNCYLLISFLFLPNFYLFSLFSSPLSGYATHYSLFILYPPPPLFSNRYLLFFFSPFHFYPLLFLFLLFSPITGFSLLSLSTFTLSRSFPFRFYFYLLHTLPSLFNSFSFLFSV